MSGWATVKENVSATFELSKAIRSVLSGWQLASTLLFSKVLSYDSFALGLGLGLVAFPELYAFWRQKFSFFRLSCLERVALRAPDVTFNFFKRKFKTFLRAIR